MSEERDKITPGDVMQLVSGDLKMTVEKAEENGYVDVVWLDDVGEVRRAKVPLLLLIRCR